MQPRAEYNVAVGYLRAFVRFLVFCLHSFVAYFPGPLPALPLVLRMSIPISDTQHFAGTRILIAFNEITAMSLMFFLSGMVMWPSLSRKGAKLFVRERVERLGLPFLVSGVLLAALAYYPAYLQATAGRGDPRGYFGAWMNASSWMPGPAWFLPVLFAYDAAAAVVFLAAPRWGWRLGAFIGDGAAKPLRVFVIVVAVSAAAYVPIAVLFGPYDWWRVGPFWVQKCRVLQYGVYFFLGAGVGAFGLNQGLAAKDGMLARRWPLWVIAMVVVFLVVANAELTTVKRHVDVTVLGGSLVAIGWVICCAASSFALLAVFARFAKRHAVLSNFADNSYGIYLVHYPLVTWTQFALLGLHISPILKAIIVLATAVSGGWAIVAALRRIPAVRRVV